MGEREKEKSAINSNTIWYNLEHDMSTTSVTAVQGIQTLIPESITYKTGNRNTLTWEIRGPQEVERTVMCPTHSKAMQVDINTDG